MVDLEKYNRVYPGNFNDRIFENDLVYKKVSNDRFELVLPGGMWGDKRARSLLDLEIKSNGFIPTDVVFPGPQPSTLFNSKSEVVYFHYFNSPEVYDRSSLNSGEANQYDKRSVMVFSFVDMIVEPQNLRLVIEVSFLPAPLQTPPSF